MSYNFLLMIIPHNRASVGDYEIDEWAEKQLKLLFGSLSHTDSSFRNYCRFQSTYLTDSVDQILFPFSVFFCCCIFTQ